MTIVSNTRNLPHQDRTARRAAGAVIPRLSANTSALVPRTYAKLGQLPGFGCCAVDTKMVCGTAVRGIV